MARAYPRFIKQEVIKAKSTGTFVVHTLHPKCIATLVPGRPSITVEVLEWWDEPTEEEQDAVLKRMTAWLIGQQ